MCIPVMNEPFTDQKKKKKINGERVNHASEDLVTADCESSFSWLAALWKQKPPRYLDQ